MALRQNDRILSLNDSTVLLQVSSSTCKRSVEPCTTQALMRSRHHTDIHTYIHTYIHMISKLYTAVISSSAGNSNIAH